MTKESTYGWYPSVRSIYDNGSSVKGQEREALFRYYQQHMNREAPDTPEPWRTSQPGTPASQIGAGLTVTKASISPRAAVRGSSSRALSRTKSAPATKPTSTAGSAVRTPTNINTGKVPQRAASGADRAKSATTARAKSTKANTGSCAVNVGTARPKSAMSISSQGSARPSMAPSPYTQARNAYAQRFIATQEIPTQRPETATAFEVPFAQPMRNIPTPSLSNYEFNVVTPKPTIDFHIDTPELMPQPQAVEIPKPASPTEPEDVKAEMEAVIETCNSPEVAVASPAPSNVAGKSSRQSGRGSRVQSATTRRERSAIPPRPARSACGHRTPSSVGSASIPSPAPSKAASSPVINITPCKDVDSSTIDMKSYTKQYEEIVEKYGWRAQVHGNPLKLKKVMPRLAYTVKCEEPTLPPEPPRFHWQNYDTYFQNTIPHQPMSFTIHPHFVSETLNTKRMELQRREGVKYRFKDYAFHY